MRNSILFALCFISGINATAQTALALAGRYHSLGLMDNGTVWTWGLNVQGQLGDGTNTERHIPGQVSGISDVISVSAGPYQNFAINPLSHLQD